MAGGSPGNQSGLSGCGPPSFYSSPGSANGSPQQANTSGNAATSNGGNPGTSPQLQNASSPCGSAPGGVTAANMSSSSSPGSGTGPGGNNPVGNVSPGRVVCGPPGGSPGRMVVGGSPQGGGTQGLSPPPFLNNSGGANTTGASDSLNISIPNVSAVMADMSNLSDTSRTQSPGQRQAGPSPLNRSVPQQSPQQPCDPQQSRFYYPGRVTTPGASTSYSFDTSGLLNRNITLEGTMDNILQNDSNIPAYQFDQLTEGNAAYWMQPGHVGFPLKVEKRRIVQTPNADNAVYLAQSTPVAIHDQYRQPAWKYVNASPVHPPTPAGPQNYSGYSFLNDSALLEGNISDWADPYRDRSLNYSQQMPSTYSPPPRPEPFPADRIIETPQRGCDVSAGSPDYRMASFFRTPSPQRPGNVSTGSPDYRMASFFRTPPPQQRPLDMSSGSPDYRMASFFRTPPPQQPLDMSSGSPDYRMASFFRTPPPQRPMDVSAGSPDYRLASFFRTPPPQRQGDVSYGSPDYRMASFFRTPPPQRPGDVSFALQSSAEANRSAGSPGTGASTTHTYSPAETSTGAESSGSEARAAGQTFNVSPAADESGRAGGSGCCGPPAPNAASPRGPGGGPGGSPGSARGPGGGPGASPASARGFPPGELPSYLGGSPERSGGGPAGSAGLGGPTFNLSSLVSTPRRPPSICNGPNVPSAMDLFSSCFELLLRRIMMGNMVPVVNDLIEMGIWPWRFCDCPQNQNRMNTMMSPIAHSTPNPRNETPMGGTYTRLFNGLPNPPFPPASWLAEQQGLEQQQQENSRNAEADSSLATGFSYLSRMPPMADPTFLGGGAPPGPPPACSQACGGQQRASPQQPPPQQVIQSGSRSLRVAGPQTCPTVQRPYQSLNGLDNYGRTNASNPDFNGDSYY